MQFLVANETDRQAAERFMQQFEGRSYLKFHFSLAPCEGSFNVLANTDKTDDETDARRLLLCLMYSALAR